jgi:hypothetical protein
MQTITLKTSGSGKIQINSIIPDTSSGWSGEYSADCPVTLTALPDKGAQFTGWSGDVSGSEKTVTVTLREAMTITANFGEKVTVRGDVNADGEFNVADVVTLQNWMLGRKNTVISDEDAADLSENGRLDIFDLIIMKRELFN